LFKYAAGERIVLDVLANTKNYPQGALHHNRCHNVEFVAPSHKIGSAPGVGFGKKWRMARFRLWEYLI